MNVICLGSLNIDHVYQVERFVKEGETLAATSMALYCGGKGLNQSVALAKAGCMVFHAGLVGADGGQLLHFLQGNGVRTEYIQTIQHAPTGHAVIQVDGSGQNGILVYGGANACIDETYIDSVYADFSKGDIVLLQNEISSLPYAIDRAHQLGFHVALNPSPITAELRTMDALQNVTWLIVNEGEGNLLSRKREPMDICRALRQQYAHAQIMLTLGSKGCVFFDGEQFAFQEAYQTAVVDTTAAGDTFTGYFLAGVCEGLPVSEILKLASKAASLAVSRHGAAQSIPARDEIVC